MLYFGLIDKKISTSDKDLPVAQVAEADIQPTRHAGIATGAGTNKIQPVKVQMRRRDFIL